MLPRVAFLVLLLLTVVAIPLTAAQKPSRGGCAVTEARMSLAAMLEAEHRSLDELFGRFLAAAQMQDAHAARQIIEDFDATLRRHMSLEEERLYSLPSGRRLAPGDSETDPERCTRELLLEHVQIRELSGMMRRLLAEKEDLASARGLAGNLARRWDAHTSREEREVFPRLELPSAG